MIVNEYKSRASELTATLESDGSQANGSGDTTNDAEDITKFASLQYCSTCGFKVPFCALSTAISRTVRRHDKRQFKLRYAFLLPLLLSSATQ